MKIALVIVGLILIAATALPLVRSEEWWIRALDFPRLQIAALLALVIASFVFLFSPASVFDPVFLILLAVSLGCQVWQIFPYTPLAPLQVVRASLSDSPYRVRLLVANVLMDNRRADQFLDLVKSYDPDIVLAVETDAWWDKRLAVLQQAYPFWLRCPLENTYGMHLFSKLELGSPEVRFLIQDDVPSIRAQVRLCSGDWITFYGVHPCPPRPGQDTEQRDAELVLVGREVASSGRPSIIAGDLNDVAWSHTTRLFQRISHTLDPRVGRGMFSTFPAQYPVLRWPLDHVFHTKEFALGHLKRLPLPGSDHFSVLAELVFSPESTRRQDAPAADGDDRAEATEKIEKGRAAS